MQTECAIGKDENKLVAVERVALTPADVPALFYLVDRKPLSDFDGTAPHEGWAMTLSALATKLKLWLEKRPDHPEAAAVREKIVVLEKAASAERAALDARQPSQGSAQRLGRRSPLKRRSGHGRLSSGAWMSRITVVSSARLKAIRLRSSA